jgi:PAS domain S-box-containing protein
VHPLLARQLKRFFKGEALADPRVAALAQAVDEAYLAADDERALLEHSLQLSSRELEERYATLRADVARREVAESERDGFFRLIPDLLCIIDTKMRLVQVNPGWTRLLGYGDFELIGRTFTDLVHPEDLEHTLGECRQLLVDGSKAGVEIRFRHLDGGWRWLSWAATVDRSRGLTFAIARDITAKRELQRELAQAQKLEAVGQLASGVAHEINTPMQFIGDNVQFSLDAFADLERWVAEAQQVLTRASLPPAERAALDSLALATDLPYQLAELPRALGEARDGVRRVAELVQALKEFAHADQPEMHPADINEALERTLVLTRGNLKHVALVEADLEPLPPVRCHVGLLNQAFLNLLVNAGHAIEDGQRKGGRRGLGLVKVATRLDEQGLVEVRISDSGCGIPLAVRERIFEPFFTTKEVGRGSGQGLPLVRSVVVDRHGGQVTFESEVDVGTTFIIRLPVEPAAVRAKVA